MWRARVEYIYDLSVKFFNASLICSESSINFFKIRSINNLIQICRPNRVNNIKKSGKVISRVFKLL